MTTVATNYEVTSSPPMIGPSTILPTPTDASRLRWRAISQRSCKPPKPSRIRTSKRSGLQPLASLWQHKPGAAAGLKDSVRGMIPGSARVETVHDHRASGWQSSGFGDVDMLVNFSGLMAHVQANMVLLSVAVALGSLILATLLLLGVSILCHPVWIVRWTQKLQPHVLYLKPTQEKVVALTLDDGPHAHITPQLLDILRENDCKATWFLIGNHMELCPHLVQRIHAEGHEVANHMMDDAASWMLSKQEFEAQLVECDNRLANFFRSNSSGQPLKWFRPGHGFYNPQIVQTCKEHGYRIALGSLYPMDHMFVRQAKLLAKNLLWRIHPGAVIILHDRVPQWEQTPQVLRLLLPELKKRGYKIVTLSELESMRTTELKRSN